LIANQLKSSLVTSLKRLIFSYKWCSELLQPVSTLLHM